MPVGSTCTTAASTVTGSAVVAPGITVPLISITSPTFRPVRVSVLPSDSLVSTVYGTTRIQERHRHRWEVNVHYREGMETKGLRFSGMSPDGILPEIVERPDHPWFIGVQYHPELKSKPLAPHPLFSGFIRAAVKQSRLV